MFIDYINVGKTLWFLVSILLCVMHLGDSVDPTTIEVGSPEWADYVKQYQMLRT